MNQQTKSRNMQNFILVWLDSEIDPTNNNRFRNSIIELEGVFNDIKTFDGVDKCFDFITDVANEKIMMIISDQLASDIIPLTHNIPQINSFYILCKNRTSNQGWMQQWLKVQKISTVIEEICEALKQDVRQYARHFIPISFVSIRNQKFTGNLDQLDPTFMYTRILKETLLTINFNDKHIKEFTKYYRQNFGNNRLQLDAINELEKNYSNDSPIRWYTYGHCVYPVLNQALRLMELDTIIKMGFFIRDLHNEITKLYARQCSLRVGSGKFTIYRGQHLSKSDFDRMMATQGGLISFNSFLSTTRDLTVALRFAQNSSLDDSDTVGIIFVMTIDPSIKSTPFASIENLSHYELEEEILFSMNTVFRIDSIIKSSDDKHLWQIDLIQTKDNDPQLNALTDRVRKEIEGSTEWDRLGKLLIKLGEFSKAEELYQILMDEEDTPRKKAQIYHQLAWSKKKQKQYPQALEYYKKSLEIKQKHQFLDIRSLSNTLNEIGSVYEMMKEYSEALAYYEQALEINRNARFSDQHGLALSYSRMGSVYENMDNHSEALSYYKRAIEIRENTNPIDYVNLAYCYNNIGSVYKNMGDYFEAISVHQKALDCQRKVLPDNHPDIAHSYTSLSFVYDKMGQYEKAREYKQRAVAIGERSLPENHPHLRSMRKSLNYRNKNFE